MGGTGEPDTNERVSFEPEAPIEKTIAAAKERLRQPPRFPDLPPDADPWAILRAVCNIAFDMNERERHLIAVVEHNARDHQKNQARVTRSLKAIDERVSAIDKRLEGIEASVAALHHTGGSR